MLEENTVQDLWSWNGPLRARCDHYLTSPEFTAQGLLLGPRIRVLRADCTKAAATLGSPSLGSDPLDGDLPRARALLSVAYGYPISPWQMSRLQAAAAVTGQRPALAGIILAHAGLSGIPATPAHAERLYHAEKLLDSAVLSPIALLDALDLLPDDWVIHKNHRESQPVLYAGKAHQFNQNQPRVPPGCPEGGRFACVADGAGAIVLAGTSSGTARQCPSIQEYRNHHDEWVKRKAAELIGKGYSVAMEVNLRAYAPEYPL